MARYGMVIDFTKCTGCYNCFLTCRDEFAAMTIRAMPPPSR